MRILLLAPQPYFQERGTPIAVDLMLRCLSSLGHTVCALVMEEGEDRSYPGVELVRSRAPASVQNLGPGFSIGKLLSDGPFYKKALQLAEEWKPDVIHAIEEAAFMAHHMSKRTGIPYIFDMDSSIPQQMVEKNKAFAAVTPVLKQFETKALRRAAAVVPVCAALEDVARKAGAVNIHRIEDVSLLDENLLPSLPLDRDPPAEGSPVFMYVGNLEVYQGLDLFLQAASLLHQEEVDFQCVVVGGRPEAVNRYTDLAEKLGIAGQVDFWGPKPLAMMSSLFRAADILVSPRLKGVNTPMKLYSYLDSGNPVLATNLSTHTQVVTEDHVMLADPEPEPFAQAMKRLALDPALRARLAARAKSYVQKEFTLSSYERKVKQLYDSLPPSEPAA